MVGWQTDRACHDQHVIEWCALAHRHRFAGKAQALKQQNPITEGPAMEAGQAMPPPPGNDMVDQERPPVSRPSGSIRHAHQQEAVRGQMLPDASQQFLL